MPSRSAVALVASAYSPFLLQARTDMEQQSIEGASTSDAVGFITVVQLLKRKIKSWEKNVEVRYTRHTRSCAWALLT